MSLMDLGFLNVTNASLLVNGLVALDLSTNDQYLEVISFIGGLTLLYVLVSSREMSSFSHLGGSGVIPLNFFRQIARLLL